MEMRWVEFKGNPFRQRLQVIRKQITGVALGAGENDYIKMVPNSRQGLRGPSIP
jgi:hypothetical protein